MSKIIAAALCNPESCPNLRIKSNPADADATVAIQLHTFATYTQSSESASHVYSASQPLGTGVLALFRDAFRAYVQFEANPGSAVYSYTAYGVDAQGLGNTVNIPVGPAELFTLAPNWLLCTTSYAPHDKYLFPGISPTEDRWLWMDLGSVMTFTQSITLASTLYAYYWDGQSAQEAIAEVAFSSGTAAYTCTVAGYFNFEILNTTTTSYTVTMVYSGASETYSHHAAPNVFDHLPIMTDHRVDAASLMMSPVSNQFEVNGNITAAWLAPGQLWTGYTSPVTLGALKGAQRFPFRKGVYAFVKPHSSNDFDYVHTVHTTNGVVTSCGFRLDDPCRTVMFSYVVDATNSTTSGAVNVAKGCEYVLSYNTGMEMVSNDQWHEQHNPGTTYPDFVAALEAVSVVTPFHENPKHWSELYEDIRLGFNKLRTHATKASTVLSTIFPQFAPVIAGGGALLSALPEWQDNRRQPKRGRAKQTRYTPPARAQTPAPRWRRVPPAPRQQQPRQQQSRPAASRRGRAGGRGGARGRGRGPPARRG